MRFPCTSALKGRATAILSLRATFPFLLLRALKRCAAISLAPRDCFVASLLIMTERGRAFSGREECHSRIVGAGFSTAGCMGKEAVR